MIEGWCSLRNMKEQFKKLSNVALDGSFPEPGALIWIAFYADK